MTSAALRRAGVPLAVALLVLAVVLAVTWLADPSGEPGDGVVPGAGGGVTGSAVPGSTGSAVPGSPGSEPPASASPDQPQRMSRFVSVAPGSAATLLEVRFWGGVETCYAYEVRAGETEQSVRLRLVERRRSDGPCIELARQYDRTVRLQRPLGERPVIDADTSETLLAPPG